MKEQMHKALLYYEEKKGIYEYKIKNNLDYKEEEYYAYLIIEMMLEMEHNNLKIEDIINQSK